MPWADKGSCQARHWLLPAAWLLAVALALVAASPAAAAGSANATATAAPATAAAANSTASCYYSTHFLVLAGLPACQTRCQAKLAAAGGVGSICPKLYTTAGGTTCCKCQYRRKASACDPNASSDGQEDDDAVVTDSDLASQQAAAASGATTQKKGGFRWWKKLIVITLLVLVVVVTLGALVWDCLKRRRSKDDAVEVKLAVQEAMDKKKGGKKRERADSSSKGLPTEAQKRLEALDLALEMRQMKLEAQQAARFEVVVTAGGASPAQPASPARGTSSSLPASPARSRFQRMRAAVNPFS
ncbi:hypothetical protein ABPG75_005059 [Micractinium tetrahymenae]